MLSALVLVVAAAGPVDDRLVLTLPNLNGHNGVLRTTSALTGDTGAALLGVNGRFFTAADFLLDDIADANTFAEGNVAASFAFFRIAELAVSSRAGINLNSARAQPATSVGDTTVSLKAGYSFGVVALAAAYRAGLPTRANKVGFELENVSSTLTGAVTVDLLQLDLPLRLHLNGFYTAQPGQLADDGDDKFLFDGEDGALLALATQQWFWDRAGGGLAVEVPLPYVTPYIEAWFQSAVITRDGVDYDVGKDAWLIVSPGVRGGVGGLGINAAVDLGLIGNAGGSAPQANLLVDGQPLNPLWAVRVGVAHAFDVFGAGGGGGGGGAFTRVSGCVVDDSGPVAAAVVAVSADGQPGPRLLADDRGCFDAPLPQPSSGTFTLTTSDATHPPVTTTATPNTPVTVKLTGVPQRGRIAGFVTTKEDDTLDVALMVKDGASWRDVGSSTGGAFDVDVAAGVVVVVAKADGYLMQAVRAYVAPGAREARTLVLRKVPKKRSATLTADKIDTTARVPFEFKKPRLQSTSEYLLDEIVDLLLANPNLRLSIEAHTDASEVADASEAKALTEGRARAVKDALVERGVDGARLETAGYGITQPIAPNDPKNRRVEFLVVK